MALPPTIPTSFVPHLASAATREYRTNYSSAFLFIVYGILGIAFVLAVGLFIYNRILDASITSNKTEISKAESDINSSDATDFIRLRNRLASSKTLLSNHVAFSGFLTTLESILPTTVRMSTLHIIVDSGGKINLDAVGVAKNFNALAFVSKALADDGRIKDAIFSNIKVNQKDNTVSFSLSAVLDSKIVEFRAVPESQIKSGTIATSTALTATSTKI